MDPGQVKISRTSSAHADIDAQTLNAAHAFLNRLHERQIPSTGLLYGSRARGTHTPDSDADIAVILEGPPGDRYKALRDMSDAAYDILLETGVHLQPMPLWELELSEPGRFANPALIEAIKREGLTL